MKPVVFRRISRKAKHVCVLCISAVVFIAGSGMYVKAAPKGNIMLQVSKCIGVSVLHWDKRNLFAFC